ncbi:Vacuolar protein 8 [Coemansia interrupta]|uniref:Vacuolar protein 8 n=1 Tax=Coemansia interrupta TaxID=1126814 RepID=A0A9W8LI28_9FUNG|nr:Vacuolar protein 8 [Coemansia interrupta]
MRGEALDGAGKGSFVEGYIPASQGYAKTSNETPNGNITTDGAMGASVSSTVCCGAGRDGGSAGERRRLVQASSSEQRAVAVLSRLFERDTRINFYSGEALDALATLARSDVHQLQLSAATAFSEVSAYDVRAVSLETITTVVGLLGSAHADVQQGAGAALGNLAGNMANKRLIVQSGGLAQLVRQLLSPSVEAQANAAGCITNVAADGELKAAVARSGALVPLVRLARSRDVRVARNAAGALLNMTHAAEHRQQLVAAGAAPALVALLDSGDGDTRYYAATAVGNVAADAAGRELLWRTQPLLVDQLVALVQQPGGQRGAARTQAQAALALRNLASDERYQAHAVVRGAAPALAAALRSPHPAVAAAAAACLRNLSIAAANEAALVAAGVLAPLAALVSGADREAQGHALATLRNLAANGGVACAQALLDCGVLDHMCQALSPPPASMAAAYELAAALGVFAAAPLLWRPLVERGLCRHLVRLLRSPCPATEYAACCALRTLAARRTPEVVGELAHLWVVAAEPRAGLRAYVLRALADDAYKRSPVRAIAMWLVVALLGCARADLRRRIVADVQLMAVVECLARQRVARDTASLSGSDTCSVASDAFAPAELVAVGEENDDGNDDDDDQASVRTCTLARQVVALLHGDPAAACLKQAPPQPISI